MSEQSIITRRIEEVKAESVRLRAKLAENDKELVELETAASVIARLTGAERPETVTSDATSTSKDAVRAKNAKPEGLPTMPELILMALKQEKRAMEPREITEVIRRNWWPEVDGQKIGSIVWRLNNRKDIEKVEGTSTYRLPQIKEASDTEPGRSPSEASLFPVPEAKGLESQPRDGGT
ncbi:hypothetical protein [uncultured Tateyamaria sp.]|uniref:hypothetical protein n=1 Tax=Tateyamaria sp. 1078 TaxID=3417464 RepID=UPI002602B36D|nr:hypothetical protein [uncultured Tateyamaria sp.]